jgi:hypothetical protein
MNRKEVTLIYETPEGEGEGGDTPEPSPETDTE